MIANLLATTTFSWNSATHNLSSRFAICLLTAACVTFSALAAPAKLARSAASTNILRAVGVGWYFIAIDYQMEGISPDLFRWTYLWLSLVLDT